MRGAELDPTRSAEEECGMRSSTRGGVRKRIAGCGVSDGRCVQDSSAGVRRVACDIAARASSDREFRSMVRRSRRIWISVAWRSSASAPSSMRSVVPRDRFSGGPEGVPVEAILVGGRRTGVLLGDIRSDGSDRLRQLINRAGPGELPVRLSIEGVTLDRVRREPIRLHRPERIPGLRSIPRGDPCVKCWKCARCHARTMPRAYAPCVIESPLPASISRLTACPAPRIPLPHPAPGRVPHPAFLFRTPPRVGSRHSLLVSPLIS